MPGITVKSHRRQTPGRAERATRAAEEARGHYAGSIKWLPPRNMVPGIEQIDEGWFNHPVVILSPKCEDGKVVILPITSFGGKSLDERHATRENLWDYYLPIEPSKPHPNTDKLLKLEHHSMKMRKSSYICTKKLGTITFTSLRRLKNDNPEIHLSLRSYKELIEEVYFFTKIPHPWARVSVQMPHAVPAEPAPRIFSHGEIFSRIGNSPLHVSPGPRASQYNYSHPSQSHTQASRPSQHRATERTSFLTNNANSHLYGATWSTAGHRRARAPYTHSLRFSGPRRYELPPPATEPPPASGRGSFLKKAILTLGALAVVSWWYWSRAESIAKKTGLLPAAGFLVERGASLWEILLDHGSTRGIMSAIEILGKAASHYAKSVRGIVSKENASGAVETVKGAVPWLKNGIQSIEQAIPPVSTTLENTVGKEAVDNAVAAGAESIKWIKEGVGSARANIGDIGPLMKDTVANVRRGFGS
ncbi:hypothetical protein F5Y15DRAFT_25242 [Xylariaceae sp. FL0016]|nr:hypothetical protein F5Y15DRAFT_25242 [Xylariaceae sp. FL0016]